jgi:hypothetical protein
LDNILETNQYLEYDVERKLDDITFDMMKYFVTKWPKKLHIQVLAQGNILKSTASTIVKDILTSINCRGIQDVS